MAIPPPTGEEQLREVEDGEELVVYRVVKSEDSSSDGFLDSLRSNAALGKPPRAQEITHPLLHDGISVWEERAQAEEMARAFPAMGGFVTELRLKPGVGRHYAWGSRPGHLTVWADALTLRTCAADTMAVGQQK